MLKIIDTIYDVLTALEKIGYVTDLQLDKNVGTATIESEEGLSIQVSNLKFGFPDDAFKILTDVSFNIQANEKTVLCGPPGSGKSLLLQILAGIHEIEEGELFVNGIPFSSYQRNLLYGALGISFHTNQIFEGSFRENIVLGREINEKKVLEVLSLLQLQDYIMRQPLGLDSFVDSGGRRLPRSVIQKLLIARIIVYNPRLILMEDPLQFIPEDEKKRIIDYLMGRDKKWTIIVVSDFYYWQEKSNNVITLTK